MPYATNSDLPESVKDNLPAHAQDIYREAFNSAWEQYKDPKERRDKDDTREETAHKVAWAAVKKKYEKPDEDGDQGGKWRAKG
ncbi:putative cation transport regulator ChaB [Enhygromyxa salina]|uniref:Cation transport regulator ChaB n=1 Tax=Enhygromyxa salina TaxID=215803 RepID=A0A2S9Y7V8_9BACT|nr:putative cation transport regulator ChaB [Enhygromyxa salina]PRQ01189.1 Cation transport regulator ChaB [Enhygromyxa salina]